MITSRTLTFLCILGCGIASVLLLGANRPQSARPQVVVMPALSHGQAAAVVVESHELLHETAPIEPESAGVHEHKKVVWMTVTAYCSCPRCCGPKARGLTASGRSIAYNGGQFVAADTKLFKFGTQLQIPGYAAGQAVEVIDRGSAIKGYHIDLFFPSHEQAKQWGKRYMAVTVVE
jgi:3D (Asp-Asp-Asp) domain-containing protein